MQVLRGAAFPTCIFCKLDLSHWTIGNDNANSTRVGRCEEYRHCPRALEYVVGTSLRHIVTRVVRLVVQGLPAGAGVAAGSAEFESQGRSRREAAEPA
jgi:hypothetical protein